MICAIAALVLARGVASPVIAEGAEPGALVSSTYLYSGQGESFAVPEGVGFLAVSALGANGGFGGIYVEPIRSQPDVLRAGRTPTSESSPTPPEGSFAPGGEGGSVHAALPVTPGATLEVNVGGAGEGVSTPPSERGVAGVRTLARAALSSSTGALGGYGGGANGGGSEFSPRRAAAVFGGGGGGASTVSGGGEPLVVAGGGGGGGGDGGGRTGSDSVQIEPGTYTSGSGSGNDPVAEIPNLNIGDIEIVNLDWDTTHVGDTPSTPAGWTLVDLGSYGEVGEVATSFRPGITHAYSATYEKVATEAGGDYQFFHFPNREIDFQLIAFAVANADDSQPIAAHDLLAGRNASDQENFPAISVPRAHSAVLTITDFPQYLPPFNGFGSACAVEEYPTSPAPAALSSGTFAPLNSCDGRSTHDAAEPGGVSYLNDAPAGSFSELTFTWTGYTNVLGGEELVLQPPAGAGGEHGALPSSGGAGGGSDGELGVGEAGGAGTIDPAETEPGLGGAGGAESSIGSAHETGGPGGSDEGQDDPDEEGGFTGGGGGGGYFGGVGGAFAQCPFVPCQMRGAGGGGGGSDYAEPQASAVSLTRAGNARADGNGEVTIAYYTPYPSETEVAATPSSADTASTVELSGTIIAGGSCAGSVQFSLDGKEVEMPVSVRENAAQTTVTAPPAGTHQLSAVYSGALSSATEPGCLPSTGPPASFTTHDPPATPLPQPPPPPSVLVSITPAASSEALVAAPKACASVRRFAIHLQLARAVKLLSARVYLDGKLVKRLPAESSRYYLDLGGRPYSTITVTLVGVRSDGTQLTGKRVYHTCRAHKLPGHTKFRI